MAGNNKSQCLMIQVEQERQSTLINHVFMIFMVHVCSTTVAHDRQTTDVVLQERSA